MIHFLCLLLASLLVPSINAFIVGSGQSSPSIITRFNKATTVLPRKPERFSNEKRVSLTSIFAEPPKDVSRSGFRRDRLDKLAELEDTRIETDKGFVIYAAGGFALLILLGVFAAFVLQV